VVRLDAQRAGAILKTQMNQTDENDVEGFTQTIRPGWRRSGHVRLFDAHPTRGLLGARAEPVGMTMRLSRSIRGRAANSDVSCSAIPT
jgi:hypothetical protein